jgi:hypothetical protein
MLRGLTSVSLIRHRSAAAGAAPAVPADLIAWQPRPGRCGRDFKFFLKCSTKEIVRRVGNADRMASEQGVRNFVNEHNVCPVPRHDCLVLNSETRSAEANAQEITHHFNPA